MYETGTVQNRPVPRGEDAKAGRPDCQGLVLTRVMSDDLAPIVKLTVSSSKEVEQEPGRRISSASSAYEWDQTFTFCGTALESTGMLEVSVWTRRVWMAPAFLAAFASSCRRPGPVIIRTATARSPRSPQGQPHARHLDRYPGGRILRRRMENDAGGTQDSCA